MKLLTKRNSSSSRRFYKSPRTVKPNGITVRTKHSKEKTPRQTNN